MFDGFTTLVYRLIGRTVRLLNLRRPDTPVQTTVQALPNAILGLRSRRQRTLLGSLFLSCRVALRLLIKERESESQTSPRPIQDAPVFRTVPRHFVAGIGPRANRLFIQWIGISERALLLHQATNITWPEFNLGQSNAVCHREATRQRYLLRHTRLSSLVARPIWCARR